MNAHAVTARVVRAGGRRRPPARLVRAELLKLRRRRGLIAATLGLTVVPVLVHAVFAGQDGSAGGLEGFIGAMDLLWGMTVIAAILVGATLGTGDRSAGVFRELVVTGRSRLALFGARVPAGLVVLLPIVGAGFAVAATLATVLAGPTETSYAPGHHGDRAALVVGNAAPGASLLAASAGWLALGAAASMLVALGVSSALGSRGTAIGVLLGWFLVAMPLLLDPAFGLGGLRDGLLYAATDHFKPAALLAGAVPGSPMPSAVAVAVLVTWAVAPLALGAWRTCTRDA